MLYWLIAIFGVFDMDTLDLDVDVEADMDVEADFSFLKFMNLGDVPVMIVVTFFTLTLWVGAVISNHFWVSGFGLLFLGVLAANIVVSLLIAKVLTAPIAVVFRKATADARANFKYEGSVCTLKSDLAGSKVLQCEIQMEGAPILALIKAREGENFKKGDQVIIVDKDPKKNQYIVEKFNEWN